jgi:hypothetical protein
VDGEGKAGGKVYEKMERREGKGKGRDGRPVSQVSG